MSGPRGSDVAMTGQVGAQHSWRGGVEALSLAPGSHLLPPLLLPPQFCQPLFI